MIQVVEPFESILPGREIVFTHRTMQLRGTVIARSSTGKLTVQRMGEGYHQKAKVSREHYQFSLVPDSEAEPNKTAVELAIAVIRNDLTALPPLIDCLIEQGRLPEHIAVGSVRVRQALRELVEAMGSHHVESGSRLDRALRAAREILGAST
jgi:hypothetical protein